MKLLFAVVVGMCVLDIVKLWLVFLGVWVPSPKTVAITAYTADAGATGIVAFLLYRYGVAKR